MDWCAEGCATSKQAVVCAVTKRLVLLVVCVSALLRYVSLSNTPIVDTNRNSFCVSFCVGRFLEECGTQGKATGKKFRQKR